jgi:hypothetical protein
MKKSVAQAVAQAEAAFKNGQLNEYKPVIFSNAGDRSTSFAAWGTSNKR